MLSFIKRIISAIMSLFIKDNREYINRDGYELVFNDEFCLPDGSRPDENKWTANERNPSIWARWINTNNDTVFIRDGKLVCLAIPNMYDDDTPMITGAIDTAGRFSLKYGYVEVRMRTNRKVGNFPAAWLKAGSEYKYAEIDIVEMFGDTDTVAHNIHSYRTVGLGLKPHVETEIKVKCDFTKWHTYGVEWTSDRVTWYVDDVKTGEYLKPSDKTLLDEGAWTFDCPMTIRLNQSVGDGSHEKLRYPDVNSVYETEFDWVRVYKKTDGYE